MAGEKNFWKDFLGRFSHPIIGAFTFYWLIINWEIVYFLFKGGTEYKETIAILNHDYINNQETVCGLRHWYLFWLPAILTTAYVLFGSFFGDMVSQIPKWTEGFWDRWSPVPKKSLTEAQAAKAIAEREKDLHIESYRLATQSVDPQQQIVSLQRQAIQYTQENNNLKAEVAQLRLDRVTLEKGSPNDIIRSENSELKKKNDTVIELLNKLLEFRTNELQKLVNEITIKGETSQLSNIDTLIQDFDKLLNTFKDVELLGLKKELLPKERATKAELELKAKAKALGDSPAFPQPLKSPQMETEQKKREALAELWKKLLEMEGSVEGAVNTGLRYSPDFERMTSEEFEIAINTSNLSDFEKNKMKSSKNKSKAFYEIESNRALKDADDSFRVFNNFYLTNKIYFDAQITNQVEEIRDIFIQKVAAFKASRNAPEEYALRALDKIHKDVKPLMTNIEEAIKKLLGLD
jgi:hypothetical protein